MLSQARAITLDLDDTLWDIGVVIRRAERKVGAWFAAEAPQLAEYLAGADLGALRREVVGRHPAHSHDFGFIRRRIYRDAAARIGLDDDVADAAFDEFQRWRNTVDLFDDVEQGLTALASQRPLLALTNGTADLAAVGIGRFFADSITAARAGVAKPDPQIFRFAADLAGVAPADVVHVGDDPHLDVEGARAVGMRTAWVNRIDAAWPEELPAPDIVVRDLAELAEELGAG